MENNDAPPIDSGDSGGWFGCVVLLFLFFFGPLLLFFLSSFVHIFGLALAGVLVWFLASRLLRRKMLDKRLILPGLLLIGGLAVLGLLMPKVGFLPCPSWCSREVIKRADYHAMERIFGHSLPPSFRLTQIHYPGYNLAFNGPDGPSAAEYEAVLEKRDYTALMAGAQSKEAPSNNGDWPAFSYQSKDLLVRFGNDWPAKYDKERWDDYKNAKPPKAYWVKYHAGEGRDSINSLVTVDDRASATVRLYIYTRVPYYSGRD